VGGDRKIPTPGSSLFAGKGGGGTHFESAPRKKGERAGKRKERKKGGRLSWLEEGGVTRPTCYLFKKRYAVVRGSREKGKERSERRAQEKMDEFLTRLERPREEDSMPSGERGGKSCADHDLRGSEGETDGRKKEKDAGGGGMMSCEVREMGGNGGKGRWGEMGGKGKRRKVGMGDLRGDEEEIGCSGRRGNAEKMGEWERRKRRGERGGRGGGSKCGKGKGERGGEGWTGKGWRGRGVDGGRGGVEGEVGRGRMEMKRRKEGTEGKGRGGGGWSKRVGDEGWREERINSKNGSDRRP